MSNNPQFPTPNSQFLEQTRGTILMVEDNVALNNSNSRALRLRHYQVMTALTLHQAMERLAEQEPDIILLDVMMPDGNGFDFCREIRERTTAHIIFLTARATQEDIMRGLGDGGDDYIIKPFHLQELFVRIDAAMRRRQMSNAAAQIIKKGTLTLDIIAGQAYIEGKDLLVQTKEFSLLLYLVQNEGKVIQTEDLYAKVWRRPLVEDKGAIQKAVSRLRKTLEPTGYTIRAIYGKGYVFESV